MYLVTEIERPEAEIPFFAAAAIRLETSYQPHCKEQRRHVHTNAHTNTTVLHSQDNS